MQPKLALEFLNECEQRFPVTEWQFRGYRIWPIVRSLLGTALWHSASEQAKPKSFTTRLRHRALGSLLPTRELVVKLRDASKNESLHPADALFLSRSSTRQRAGEFFCDVHCDPLRDELDRMGFTSLQLEYQQTNRPWSYPRYKPSHLITTAAVTAGFRSLLGRHRGANKLGELVDPQFLRFVELRAGPIAGLMGRQLLRRLTYIDALAEYFARVLHRVEPRVAFMVCYYTPASSAFLLATSRLGVPTVDIQHGVVSKHFMYDRWSVVPDDGYELQPDFFWAWGDDDQAVFDAWCGSPGPRVVVGGNPWDTFWRSASSQLVSPYKARLLRVRDANPALEHVLLSLQWDCGLTDELKRLMQTAGDDYFWWIRLHPVMAGSRQGIEDWARKNLGSRFNVAEATELPLPLVLAFMDLHVTRHSTVVDDARRAGVRSLALDASATDKFEGAASAGYMLYASSVPEAVSALGQLSASARNIERAPGSPPIDDSNRMNECLRWLLAGNAPDPDQTRLC